MASNTNSNSGLRINTKAGIRPDENELPFSISTQQVEEYLQSRVDSMLGRIGSNQEVSVIVRTTEPGKNFIPFMVILPTSVRADSGGKNGEKKIPSIFRKGDNDDDGATVPIKNEYYQIFNPYVYSKGDEQAFFSEDWRRARRVNRETSNILKTYRTPKATKLNNGKDKAIMFMLDPMRVFHDMLTIDNDNRSFKVEIVSVRKIQDGNYIYKVNRVLDKNNKKKYKYTLIDELNRKMRIRK